MDAESDLGKASALCPVNVPQDERVIVKGVKEPLSVKLALSNSFGFGGHNSAVMFAPYHPDGVHAAIEAAGSSQHKNGGAASQ